MSMPILPADQLDVPMADEFLRERSMLGTGGVMVMDDTTCMPGRVVSRDAFFRDESCGQCTQCREGTGWINKIVHRIERGAGSEEDLADPRRRQEEGGPTICAFSDARRLAGPGPAAPLPRRLRGARARSAAAPSCLELTIDGVEIEVAAGTTLLQALDDAGR